MLVKLENATGGRALLLGEKKVPLADVRSVTSLAPGFLTMEVKGMGYVGLRSKAAAENEDFESFASAILKSKSDYERFEQYETNSVQSYFQYYGKLTNQQNMLQDTVRTSLYRQAIVANPSDFRGAKVMDIGAGSGILSFFSAQAGAATVYAVEASSAALTVQRLADTNRANLGNAEIRVVNKPLENIGDEVEGKVDILVSEPIGTFLFNERMIESYLCARDRFLKPGGKMFPNIGDLMIAPFSDSVLYSEIQQKNAFWKNSSFFGLDLHAAAETSLHEHFVQPVVDYINPDCIMADYLPTRFDFSTCSVESLKNIEIPFQFEIRQPCLIHGIAGWFDAIFEGSDAAITLSTAPWCPGTHWYQIRFMLEKPLAVNAGQILEGKLLMEANTVQSYYISIESRIQGTNITSNVKGIDLKDPDYRFFSSPASYCPPGTPSPFGQAATEQAPPQPQQPQATWEPAKVSNRNANRSRSPRKK